MPRTSIGIGKVACLDGLKITEEQTPQGIVLAIHGNVGIEEVDLLGKHFQSILDRARRWLCWACPVSPSSPQPEWAR